MTRPLIAAIVVCLLVVPARTDDSYPSNYVAATLVRLNDNGAWSWFMDPRVIVNDGKLIVGSVRAIGSNHDNAGAHLLADGPHDGRRRDRECSRQDQSTTLQ